MDVNSGEPFRDVALGILDGEDRLGGEVGPQFCYGQVGSRGGGVQATGRAARNILYLREVDRWGRQASRESMENGVE